MTDTIRQLNDAFRTNFTAGRVVMTRSVADLDAVRDFDAFTSANDPHAEHDFGSFEIAVSVTSTTPTETIFWKIDYYNADMKAGSEDPADPAQTTRVLTIMLASDY